MKPPREKPFPSETALSTACQKRWKEEWDGHVIKIHGTAAGVKGTPDLVGTLRGRMCVVELKQPGEKPTPLQYKRLREWEAAGACAGWATSEVELDAVLVHASDPYWVNPQLARDAA